MYIWGGDVIQNATPVNNPFPIFQFPLKAGFLGGRGHYEYKINTNKIEFTEFLEQMYAFSHP